MEKQDLKKIKRELLKALNYSMEVRLSNKINEALINDKAIKPLFDNYYDCSLKYFGVSPLTV